MYTAVGGKEEMDHTPWSYDLASHYIQLGTQNIYIGTLHMTSETKHNI